MDDLYIVERRWERRGGGSLGVGVVGARGGLRRIEEDFSDATMQLGTV